MKGKPRLSVVVALLFCVCLGFGQDPTMHPGQHEPQVDPIVAPPKIPFSPMRPTGETHDAELWEDTFESPETSAYPTNNLVKLRITIPVDQNAPVPVVILLHYWGATDFTVEDELAAHLARAGIATVAMPLPYHLSRTPPGHKSGDLAVVANVPAIGATMRQAVEDVMRTVDFIQSRPEFNHRQIGVAGTSLGAILSASSFGADHRLTGAAFLFGGGDIAKLIWTSSKTQAVRSALTKDGWTEEKVRHALAPLDSVNLNSPDDKRQSLLVTARFDNVVPAESSNALLARLGNAQHSVLDTGHYGGFLIQARLGQTLSRFFQACFQGAKYELPSSIYAPTVRLGMLADTDRGLQLAIGLDVWRANRDRDGFGTILLTPKGLSLFLGADVGGGFALGASLAPRQAALGAYWSIVF